jgi:Fe2+ or Zn2+ uptake regulation protein
MTNLSMTDQVTQRLRSEGGRMTAQRKLVLAALEDLPGHPTAEEIHARARQDDPDLHLSTVYRTLRWLEESGFVNPCWFAEEGRAERFDAQSSDSLEPGHYHFVCRLCGGVIEFAEPRLADVLVSFQESFGGRVEETDLALYGLCKSCLPVSAQA